MKKIVEATWDGLVLRPDEPLPLPPNARVVLTVELRDDVELAPRSFLRTAMSLKLDGPPDRSERIARGALP